MILPWRVPMRMLWSGSLKAAPTSLVAGVQGEGDDAAAPGPLEVHQVGLLDHAPAGGHHQGEPGHELLDRQDGGDLFVLAQLHQVDDGLALGRGGADGNLVHPAARRPGPCW